MKIPNEDRGNVGSGGVIPPPSIEVEEYRLRLFIVLSGGWTALTGFLMASSVSMWLTLPLPLATAALAIVHYRADRSQAGGRIFRRNVYLIFLAISSYLMIVVVAKVDPSSPRLVSAGGNPITPASRDIAVRSSSASQSGVNPPTSAMNFVRPPVFQRLPSGQLVEASPAPRMMTPSPTRQATATPPRSMPVRNTPPMIQLAPRSSPSAIVPGD